MTRMTSGAVSDSVGRWYAVKVFYNRAVEVEASLNKLQIETYLPMTTVTSGNDGGKLIHREKPLIGSLLFIKADVDELKSVERLISGKGIMYRRPGEHKMPTPIPEAEMTLFKLVTSHIAGRVDFLGDDDVKWHEGDKVRVTAGPLEGAEGHICRIKGDRRLVVSVRGVCAVATSYIPSRFLKIIN